MRLHGPILLRMRLLQQRMDKSDGWLHLVTARDQQPQLVQIDALGPELTALAEHNGLTEAGAGGLQGDVNVGVGLHAYGVLCILDGWASTQQARHREEVRAQADSLS